VWISWFQNFEFLRSGSRIFFSASQVLKSAFTPEA
jgi:hypothetical protein